MDPSLLGRHPSGVNPYIANLPVVYADESSNSGQNLLDPDQPVFTVAGVHLPDELAASIVEEVRAQLPATQKEPKYSSLARSSNGRKALLKSFEQLPKGSVRVGYAHKEFMITTKMIDILVETKAHRDGLNLYENGARELAELLHAINLLPGLEATRRRMHEAFVGWMRGRVCTDDLFDAITEHRKSASAYGDETAGWIQMVENCRDIADIAIADNMADSLDPALPMLHVVLAGFQGDLVDFRIVHDESKVIGRHAETLTAFHVSPTPGDPWDGGLPPGNRFSFADSRDHPQLQVADWAAGAVRQWATRVALGRRDQFAEDLDPVVQQWSPWGIWPPAFQS